MLRDFMKNMYYAGGGLSVKALLLGKRSPLKLRKCSNSYEFISGRKTVRVSNKHMAYMPDIIDSFDYYFDAVEPTLESGQCVVDYSVPKYHDVRGFDLQKIMFPSFAEPIITTEQYLDFADLKEGDVVLDLGAYSGLTSIIFNQRVGSSGRVIAVEADYNNIECIKNNFELYTKTTNKIIDLLEGAVWKHGEGIYFSKEGNMGSSALEIVGTLRKSEKVKVDSYTLSMIADLFKLDKVDFIKCDIEGAETEVFKDKKFFNSFRPKVIMESHIVNGVDTSKECSELLRKHNYNIEMIEQKGVTLDLMKCTPED